MNIQTPHIKPGADVDRSPLTRALYVAKSVVEARCTIPILHNAMLRERDGALQVVTTNLECEISVTVGVTSINKDFATTVDCRQLHDLLAKSRTTGAAKFTIDGDKIAIDTGKTQFNLSTLPVDDFPLLAFDGDPNFHDTRAFKLDGTVFWELLNNVKGAMSTEETRYYLKGIYLHECDGKLVAVATDGHRLYYQEMDLPNGAAGMAGVIIPRQVIANFLALTKAPKNRPDKVSIQLCETRIDIIFDNVRIRSKVVDGTYPDYHRIIPAHNDKHVTFDANEMSAALKDVSLLAYARGSAVKLSINSAGAELLVRNPDSGDAIASIPGDTGKTEMSIGFNSGHLADLLTVIAGGEVNFALNDSDFPALITGNIDGWKAVLMPMRI